MLIYKSHDQSTKITKNYCIFFTDNVFNSWLKSLWIDGCEYKYYDVGGLEPEKYGQ